MIKIILNIPSYQYNTGRADNGNIIWKEYYDSKEKASDDLRFVNEMYEKVKNDIELSDEELEKYEDFFCLPGFQIDDAYLTILTEKRI